MLYLLHYCFHTTLPIKIHISYTGTGGSKRNVGITPDIGHTCVLYQEPNYRAKNDSYCTSAKISVTAMCKTGKWGKIFCTNGEQAEFRKNGRVQLRYASATI